MKDSRREHEMGGKISVIIPVKNEEEKIERCLEAVFEQTVQPYEVIVVDGHSTDDDRKESAKSDLYRRSS